MSSVARTRVRLADFAVAFAFAEHVAASPDGAGLVLEVGWGRVGLEGLGSARWVALADTPPPPMRWPALPAAVLAPARGLAAEPFVLPRAGDAPLAPAELAVLLGQLPSWAVQDGRLLRAVAASAPRLRWSLARALGALAEHLGHHPVLRLGPAGLEVLLWTDDVGGLTRADLVWAARAELLLARPDDEAG